MIGLPPLTRVKGVGRHNNNNKKALITLSCTHILFTWCYFISQLQFRGSEGYNVVKIIITIFLMYGRTVISLLMMMIIYIYIYIILSCK